jgi:hypothetical protein
MPTVEFGEIELSMEQADYHQYLEDLAMDQRGSGEPLDTPTRRNRR